MSNINEDWNFTPELSQKYSNLILREIPLSATGVSSRVFFYWKEKELIAYKTDDDSDKRSWVKLNYFEAFWLMMIKELRVFGIPDKHIRAIREILFKTPADLYQEGYYDRDTFLQTVGLFPVTESEREEMIKSLDDYLEGIEKVPKSDHLYVTLLGSIVSTLLLTNDQPVFFLAPNTDPETMDKKPLIIDVFTKFLTPELQQKNEWINQDIPMLTIPLRPIFAKIFESGIKDKLLLQYRLITDKESQILDLIQKGDFKEITIKMNENEPVLNVKNKGEIVGDKVKEIRRILGVKNYKNITLTFRNDKHIYYENESKL